MFYFLFSLDTIYNAFIQKCISPEVLVTQDSLNKIFELSLLQDNCFIYSPTQAIDTIKKSLNPDQQVRFREVIKPENETLGIAGFNADDVQTLSKSAKALSYNGNVIVICKESVKSEVYTNTRIVSLTPTEFISIYTKAEELKEIIDLEDRHILDYITLIAFKKESYQRIQQLIDGNNGCETTPSDVSNPQQEKE